MAAEKRWSKLNALTRLALIALAVLVVGGVLGFVLWWGALRRRRTGLHTTHGHPRLRRVMLVITVAPIIVGSGSRITLGAVHLDRCPSLADGEAVVAMRDDGEDFSVRVEKIATWAPSGLALLYAEARGAEICQYSPNHYYVAARAETGRPGAAVTVGDVVLSAPLVAYPETRSLAEHESRHRLQWAWFTVAAGPYAFPVAYYADMFFFPGSRNHFERWAGLSDGNYPPSGTGPVLGLPQIGVLIMAGAAPCIWLLRRRRRRRRTGK
ncbi:hypothetical protein HFP15_37895 [Amycolatopsis sp. K13G38]|uniref:DUF3592 domain-containing protein n=1 Tax=Amycolatopsis acididurans TaxID=2724524 RepID=A0ABX1JFQ8_9PSEU|nr:hypothetical protein [Amycolatopsis acididurans]NKQ58632.1 hypothetical protein [Amycolatopsis acididurans]